MAGRVARGANDAPASSTADAWQNVVKSTDETINTLHTALWKLNGVNNDNELIEKVSQQARTAGNTLQAQVSEIIDEV